MEEISLGATSIRIVCKAIRLDEKLTRMSLDGKDDQGHTDIRVTSETVVKNKQTNKNGTVLVHVGLSAHMCTMLGCFSEVLGWLHAVCRW